MTDIEDYETIKKIAEELRICACSWELHYQFWMVIGSIAERLFVRMK